MMTDNEIIKALECCVNADCLNCPRFTEEWHNGMCDELLRYALDLINRLKAENSNLTSDLTSLQRDLTSAKAEIEEMVKHNHIRTSMIQDAWKRIEELDKLNETAKSEAVREFAERVKSMKWNHKNFGELVYVEDIDNLLEEMKQEMKRESEGKT